MKILIGAHVQNNFLYGNRSIAYHIMDGYRYYYVEPGISKQDPEEVHYIIKAIKRW